MAKSPTDVRGNSCSHGHHHHHHHHSHGHHHTIGVDSGQDKNKTIANLRLAFLLNFLFVIIEIVGGFYTNSFAILSDAVHDLGDSLSLALMWRLEHLSKRKSNAEYSYGYYRYSTLGALVIGAVLIVSSGIILVKSIPRILNPEVTNAEGMFVFAIIGVAVNGIAAFRISRGVSLSEKMIMWHLLEDAMGWVVVLIGSVVIHIWHWYALDACLAVILAFWIAFNVFRNLKETLKVFLQATPSQIQIFEIGETIRKIPKVLDVHHGHLWSLDGQRHIYTSHVVVEKSVGVLEMSELRVQIKSMLKKFSVWEANIEIEVDGSICFDPQHSSE